MALAERVRWWCPKCGAAVTSRIDCPQCGAERVNSWKCDKCSTIITENHTCKKCGRKRSDMIYGRLVVKKLFEETGPSGHKNIDIIRRYAYSYASGKNMPLWFVEDAVSEALHNIVKYFKDYDSTREFRTWAIKIVQNAMSDMAKDDASRNEMVAFSLDAESSGDGDDILVMESVLGYTFGVDDLIAAEEKERFRIMAVLARKTFGYIATILNGEYADISIYDLAVEAYQRRDGYGWQSMVALETGLSTSLINRRQSIARKTWQKWNAKEDK